MSVGNKIIRAKEVGRRLTGLSAFGFGLNWQYPRSERDAVRRFIAFLEDRRALFNPLAAEVEDHVNVSVIEIRKRCVETIGELPEKSPAAGPVRAVAAACRRFLDEPHPTFADIDQRRREPHFFREEFGYRLRPRTDPASFFTALGELRAFIGQQLAVLAGQYEIDVQGDLTTILPPTSEGL